MTTFQPGFHTCLNCSNPTKGNYNYQGVVVCSHCFSLAQLCDRRAVKQCVDLLTMYRESLRTALVCGKLQPSTRIPKNGEKVGPVATKDLVALLKKLVLLDK